MNRPLVGNEVSKLPKGYNITRTQLGIDDKGEPIFFPNRRQRRFRITNRNKIVQFITMKIRESKHQYSLNDTIIGKVNGFVGSTPEVFLIIRRKIFHSKNAFR